jgi:hypothetical protein
MVLWWLLVSYGCSCETKRWKKVPVAGDVTTKTGLAFSWRSLRVYVVTDDIQTGWNLRVCGDVFTGKLKRQASGIRIKSLQHQASIYLCNQYQLRSLVMVSLIDVYSSHANLSRDVSRGAVPRGGEGGVSFS